MLHRMANVGECYVMTKFEITKYEIYSVNKILQNKVGLLSCFHVLNSWISFIKDHKKFISYLNIQSLGQKNQTFHSPSKFTELVGAFQNFVIFMLKILMYTS